MVDQKPVWIIADEGSVAEADFRFVREINLQAEILSVFLCDLCAGSFAPFAAKFFLRKAFHRKGHKDERGVSTME
jgi:hypothetical protein